MSDMPSIGVSILLEVVSAGSSVLPSEQRSLVSHTQAYLKNCCPIVDSEVPE